MSVLRLHLLALQVSLSLLAPPMRQPQPAGMVTPKSTAQELRAESQAHKDCKAGSLAMARGSWPWKLLLLRSLEGGGEEEEEGATEGGGGGSERWKGRREQGAGGRKVKRDRWRVEGKGDQGEGKAEMGREERGSALKLYVQGNTPPIEVAS